MSNLIIVESPAKAKTIEKYLGGDYKVLASMGHVRDLPKSKLSVDVERDFAPVYQEIPGKEELVQRLKKAAAKSERVYLATDPDREGEAISWHLAQMLELDLNEANRVTFNEITRNGVLTGMQNPRKIDIDRVDAQQARRILDRIVGYKLSPFLWRKIKKGLSAGRVQSVAVRLIVEREEEIRAFVPVEYWSISAELLNAAGEGPFGAKLTLYKGDKIELSTGEQAEAALAAMTGVPFVVSGVKKSLRKKNPSAPFSTSTLQQEASRRLGFQARRTMKAAQELYEGIEVAGMDATGLITYMRTDSLRVSDEAQQAAADYIQTTYGERYLPPSRRVYKSKAGSQDGHEAIRPTDVTLTPERIKGSLSADQYKLYKLIWERFLASQMASAELDTVSVDIAAGDYTLRASGYTVRFDGFTVLYEQKSDDEEEAVSLPPLTKSERLTVQSITPNQHFTQPPPRYTEASLIKTLEENGIGRPSTYAPTITTILAREYVERDGRALRPTALGEVTTGLMKEQFPSIVDVAFTAGMEKQLDAIEAGSDRWQDILRAFYTDFDSILTQAEKNMEGKRLKVPDEVTDVICELCGRNMVIKSGRFGKFLACPGFPECRNTKKITQPTPGICPLCGGKVLAKKSKNNRGYFGCENNPSCEFMTWDKPLADLCPECGNTLYKKGGKAGGIVCHKPGCGYTADADALSQDSKAVPPSDPDAPDAAPATKKPAAKKPAAKKPAAKKPAAKKPAAKKPAAKKPAAKKTAAKKAEAQTEEQA